MTERNVGGARGGLYAKGERPPRLSGEEIDNSESNGGDGNEAWRSRDSQRKRRGTLIHSAQMKGGVDRFSAVLKLTHKT